MEVHDPLALRISTLGDPMPAQPPDDCGRRGEAHGSVNQWWSSHDNEATVRTSHEQVQRVAIG